MPFRTVRLAPGVNLQATPTLNKVNFAVTNLVRFYSGLIQKIGGWAQLTSQLFTGTCRGLHAWADILGNAYLAIGTEQRLEVLIGGELFDITPLIDTTNPAVSFTTFVGTSTVEINDPGYSPSVGDWNNLLTQVSVGGIVAFGFYQVTAVVDLTHYQIMTTGVATSSVSGGGAVPVYTTTNGSAVITVALANHGFAVGAIFDAAVSTTVATVVIFGLYNVASVIDANTFTFVAGTTADAPATVAENGGNARIEYLLPSGLAVDTPLSGYGIGDYGAGDYGLSSGATYLAPLRQWSLDNWGQDLIASPSNGAIYYWQPPTIAPAIVVSNTAPLYSTAVFVMPQVQIILALGAETSGTQEPLLLRWCDQGDFTDWTASAINQAGSYFFPKGSKLVGGLAVGMGALLWTDQDLWQVTYLGFPLVFGFNNIASACGLIAARAAGSTGALVMWLSTRGFFQYQVGGGPSPIECPVWDFLIDNLDQMQLDQVHCAVNSLYNEMAWFFPIVATSPLWSPSAQVGYVKYNYVENAWDYGQSPQYQRTAWINKSPIGNPVGADYAGLLQQHEVGNDANGTAMIGGWQTGYFDLTEGEDYPFIDLIVPDFILQTDMAPPVITLNLLATNYPITLFTTPPITVGPLVVNTAANGTQFVPCRARARQIALSAAWSDLGTFNRIGAVRYRYAPDGRN